MIPEHNKMDNKLNKLFSHRLYQIVLKEFWQNRSNKYRFRVGSTTIIQYIYRHFSAEFSVNPSKLKILTHSLLALSLLLFPAHQSQFFDACKLKLSRI